MMSINNFDAFSLSFDDVDALLCALLPYTRKAKDLFLLFNIRVDGINLIR